MKDTIKLERLKNKVQAMLEEIRVLEEGIPPTTQPANIECEVEGCDRPRQKTIPLCRQHRRYQVDGMDIADMTPIGTNYAHNKAYGPDAKCKIDGCTEKPTARWLCPHHYHKATYIPRTKEVVPVTAAEFAKRCDRCKKVKEWQKFIRAQDIQGTICVECFRKMQRATEGKKKPVESFDLAEWVKETYATRLHGDS